MMKRITAMILALMLLVSTLSLGALADGAALTGTVKGGWLYVRLSPSKEAEPVARVYTGTQLTVLAASGTAWYQVQLSNGQTGYAMSKYITVSGGVPSEDVGSAGTLNIKAWVTSENGKSVRLRSGPSTSYSPLGSYPVGTEAVILSKGTYWFQVSIAGKTGYMMSQYLTTVQPGTGSSGSGSGNTGGESSGSGAQQPAGYTAWVVSENGKSVNLRSGAGTKHGTVGRYSVGTPVTVIVHGPEWDYIRVGTRTGYMMTKFLTTTQPGTGSLGGAAGGSTGGSTGGSVAASYTAYVTSADGNPVRMRSGAGTTYGVLNRLPVGTEVTVLSHGTTWDRIRYATTDGYMMTEFLTTVKPGTTPVTPPTSTSPTTYTAYVTSGDGKSVNLRAGAGTNYQRLVSLPVGTTVTVGASSGGWSRVTYGIYSGYMMTQFLTTVKPGTGSSGGAASGQVSGVSLNSYAPVVGTTLTASVIPAGATVNYAWVDGSGTVLSADASYIVKATDVGKTLAVRVTGKGVWSGSAASAYTAAVTAASSAAPEKISLTGVIIGGTPKVGSSLTAQAQPAGATASYIWYRLSDGAMLGSGATYTPTAADEGSALFVTAVGNGNYNGAANSAHTSAVQPAPSTGDVLLSGSVTLPAVTEVGRSITPDINLNTNEYRCYWTVDGSLYSVAGTLLVTQAMQGKTIRLTVEAIAGSGYTGSVVSGSCQVSVPAVASPSDL